MKFTQASKRFEFDKEKIVKLFIKKKKLREVFFKMKMRNCLRERVLKDNSLRRIFFTSENSSFGNCFLPLFGNDGNV